VTIGLLRVAAVVFLAWIGIKSILAAPAAQNYTLLGWWLRALRHAAGKPA
jgi:hypothetical protein